MNTSFISHFSKISDPRINRCKIYSLIEILFLSISAVLSGASGWEEIEDFGHSKLSWLRQFLPFSAGIPRHDTIARVICRLKSDEIEAFFKSWIASLLKETGSDVIAIDGKTARGSFTTKDRKNALHMVSAWSCRHQLVLGQTAVNEKSNEITAIPELLSLLDIEKSIITLDAMGCQHEIAKQIIQKNADYVLALKGNHSGMKKELEAWWHKIEREGKSSSQYDEYTEISADHGRIETRICKQMLIDKAWLGKNYRWDGLTSVIQVHYESYEKSTGRESKETRWYVSSLEIDAKQALETVRNHWQVESMHWMLDMTFREDESRIRKGRGPLAFNIMRKIAMILLKRDKSKKASISRKRKMAGLDDDFRTTIIKSSG